MIIKMFSPFKKLTQTVAKHAVFLENDYKRINSGEESDRMICKTLLALLDHEITNNSIDRLKIVRKELESFILDQK